MKNKHYGFTLAEVLLTLIIVGVITVLSFQTIKMQKTTFGFTCYHFFRDLKITVGHMASQTVGGSLASFSCDRAAESDDADDYSACMTAGKSSTDNEFLLNYKTGEGFCKGLAAFMATASSVKCTAADLNNATLENIYGGINADTVPNFTLLNKNFIYVSNRVEPSGAGSAKPYRIVSADLNGYSKPNEVGKDIISFAVFDNGEVLPLGEPAESTKYFMGVVKIRNILQRSSDGAESVLNSLKHPASIVRTSTGKNLSFKDAYCWTMGASENCPNYCSGYTSFTETFDLNMNDDSGSPVKINVSACFENQYKEDGSVVQKVNGKDYVAECDFNIIKPQVTKFFPVLQDVYSSKNNVEGIDATGKPITSQIYKY